MTAKQLAKKALLNIAKMDPEVSYKSKVAKGGYVFDEEGLVTIACNMFGLKARVGNAMEKVLFENEYTLQQAVNIIVDHMDKAGYFKA